MLDVIADLYARFVGSLDFSEKKFIEKIEGELDGGGDDTVEGAEALHVTFRSDAAGVGVADDTVFAHATGTPRSVVIHEAEHGGPVVACADAGGA